jgi:hypothetical protein
VLFLLLLKCEAVLANCNFLDYLSLKIKTLCPSECQHMCMWYGVTSWKTWMFLHLLHAFRIHIVLLNKFCAIYIKVLQIVHSWACTSSESCLCTYGNQLNKICLSFLTGCLTARWTPRRTSWLAKSSANWTGGVRVQVFMKVTCFFHWSCTTVWLF